MTFLPLSTKAHLELAGAYCDLKKLMDEELSVTRYLPANLLAIGTAQTAK
jgi:hypothetical protein